MKFLSSIVTFILIALAVCFAVSNRQSAAISLWPFDIAVEAPLYLLTLGTLVTGMVIGALIVWLSLLPRHFVARRMQSDIAKLHDKIDGMQTSNRLARDDTALAPSVERRRGWWQRGRDVGHD